MSFSSADVQAETLSQLCCCFANIKKRLYLSREKNLNSQLIFTVYKKPSVWSSLRVSVGGTKRAQEAIQPKISSVLFSAKITVKFMPLAGELPRRDTEARVFDPGEGRSQKSHRASFFSISIDASSLFGCRRSRRRRATDRGLRSTLSSSATDRGLRSTLSSNRPPRVGPENQIARTEDTRLEKSRKKATSLFRLPPLTHQRLELLIAIQPSSTA